MDVAVEVIRCGWKGKDDKRFPLSANFDKFKMLAANLGYVYENMVAQMLTAGGNASLYGTFYIIWLLEIVFTSVGM